MITKMYVNVSTFLATYKNDERGVTAIEYGLIGVAMAALLAATFSQSGSLIASLTNAFDSITSNISGSIPTPDT